MLGFSSCLGRGKADDTGLTTLVLHFREEEEKGVREFSVKPEGQVNVIGFKGSLGKEWALRVENSTKIIDNQKALVGG